MDGGERDAFLDRPWIGALSVVQGDGSPLIVPVWYRWDGDAIRVWSDPAFPWVRRIVAEPRVAFAVFEHEAPFRAVAFRGTATVLRGTFAEMRDEARAIVARYVPAADLERTVDAYDRDEDKVVVTIAPTSIRGRVNVR